MKSLVYWKHEIVAFGVYTMMITLMFSCGLFLKEYKFRLIEDRVFGWLEKGHVES